MILLIAALGGIGSDGGTGGIIFACSMLHHGDVSGPQGPLRIVGRLPLQRLAELRLPLLHGRLDPQWA